MAPTGKEDADAAMDALDAAITKAKDDVTAFEQFLKDQIAAQPEPGSLTAAQTAAVVARLGGMVSSVQAIQATPSA